MELLTQLGLSPVEAGLGLLVLVLGITLITLSVRRSKPEEDERQRRVIAQHLRRAARSDPG